PGGMHGAAQAQAQPIDRYLASLGLYQRRHSSSFPHYRLPAGEMPLLYGTAADATIAAIAAAAAAWAPGAPVASISTTPATLAGSAARGKRATV
ncbi:hypothetical protein H4R18_004638, partial [Coemansia javaensis]